MSIPKKLTRVLPILLLFALTTPGCSDDSTSPKSDDDENLSDATGYAIVSTNQTSFFDNDGEIAEPAPGAAFYGQDAHYGGTPAHYVDNGDGTITDMVTGLMWEKGMRQLEWEDAADAAAAATTGGYDDWRVPTIKELYSLIDFSGSQGTGPPDSQTPPADAAPFIDTDYFDFEYPTAGRYIDVQFLSSNVYTGTVMNGVASAFGLNVADGRIKSYPLTGTGADGMMDCRFVRGNEEYGINQFVDNGNGTVTDAATGLMWAQVDSGDDAFEDALAGFTYQDGSLNWEEALAFSQKVTWAGYEDWRLPNAKELQSLLDYSRSPDATGSAAIDPLFDVSGITNEAGQADYPFFWSSTSFEPGHDAVIVCFGRAMGFMFGQYRDVHGAGCQRTDPKEGAPSHGGPQGDVRRVYNYVRVVRDAG